MLSANCSLRSSVRIHRIPLLAMLLATASLLFGGNCSAQAPAPSHQTMPVDQVQPGMQGYAYTIFAGDQVEKFDLEVIGVMPNFLGPRQSIILVQLKGPKVERTGVVAGMSGSPVYLEGKLAGALSLKLGIFTKDPIGGVTPIENVVRPPAQVGAQQFPRPLDTSAVQMSASTLSLPTGSSLSPIETPLVFSGFQSATLQQFAPQIQSYGFVAAQGGTSAPRADDGHLVPGDRAGMVLVQGDVSINSACTVTAIQADKVFLCGHPFLNLGDVQLPMARSRVLTTLSSDLASTKIVNVGGPIGTITSDHLTAVTGTLGPPPPMIPMELTTHSAFGEKTIHAELVSHPKLTPLLMALTTLNGLTQNIVYGEGTTLKLNAEIRLKGHAPVQIENTFAPGDTLNPDGMQVAMSVMNVFTRLFTNQFEAIHVENVSVHVESVPGRQSYSIESAWLEKGEAAPGETLRLRVLVRPYRGAARIEETSIKVPDQIARGTTLRVMVSDADWMNRASHGFAGAIEAGAAGQGSPAGIDPLIALINRERRNYRTM